MKIRRGFVSNSSSSSFVILNKIPFSCPIEIAYHMIMERDWPNDGELLQKLTEMTRLRKVVEETNLSFHSTNYDTYIYHADEEKDGSRIAIYTCNNIDWKFPTYVKSADDDDEHLGYQGVQGKNFTLLETGFEGIRIPDNISVEISKQLKIGAFDLYCKSCYKEMWLLNDANKSTVICPVCGNSICTKDLTNPKSIWKKI